MNEIHESLDTNEYLFEVKGGFDIDKRHLTKKAYDGNVVGFNLSDGRTVRLVVALEVESADGEKFEYVTDEYEMSELGFSCLDYQCLNFHPVGNENGELTDGA
jgi:hypothetical protein